MIVDEVPIDSIFIKSIESGDTGQEKGGTQKFLIVELHSTVRNGL